MRQKRFVFRKHLGKVLLGLCIGTVLVCWQNLGSAGEAPAAVEIWSYLKNNLYLEAVAHTFPLAAGDFGQEESSGPGQEFYQKYLLGMFPLWQYAGQRTDYGVQAEREMTYEMLLAREGVDEEYRDGERITVQEVEGGFSKEQESQAGQSQEGQESQAGQSQEGQQSSEGQPQEGQQPQEGAEPSQAGASTALTAAEPVVHISREKLNDFDYLIQNFYIVDKTTTIDGSQLNAAELLAKDMRLATTADQPQILIHHTHSQERFADSTEDAATSIVGVGEYLTTLLREQYGFNVIHDTGEYDVIDHDNAYSYAGPAVEKILAENPSIEVVIDLHRDAVNGAPLVQEVNGKRAAKIMFFNGLSRTTARGNLDYLYNPYLQDNLAISLQLKIAAEEYYPGFTRPNFLKGYRYNLHYVPKSLLIEVGAQNNTVEEAMNAMEPLADLLHKVLMPEGN